MRELSEEEKQAIRFYHSEVYRVQGAEVDARQILDGAWDGTARISEAFGAARAALSKAIQAEREALEQVIMFTDLEWESATDAMEEAATKMQTPGNIAAYFVTRAKHQLRSKLIAAIRSRK